MKKYLKITIGLLILVAIILIIDFASIFIINRPLLAVKARQPYTYTGIFYNVYNCPEYPIPQIKSKKSKFSCNVETTSIKKVKEIVDTTKYIKNFACAEALEQFYEDNEYKYYYNCIKSKYVKVKYENGYEETVEEALKNGIINIKDLDKNNIPYLKYPL